MTEESVTVETEAGIKQIGLSEDDWKKLRDFVEKKGRDRARTQGGDVFNEDDYLAGAMAVYFGLLGGGRIPMNWIIGTVIGDSPLGLPNDRPTKYEAHDQAVKDRRAVEGIASILKNESAHPWRDAKIGPVAKLGAIAAEVEFAQNGRKEAES